MLYFIGQHSFVIRKCTQKRRTIATQGRESKTQDDQFVDHVQYLSKYQMVSVVFDEWAEYQKQYPECTKNVQIWETLLTVCLKQRRIDRANQIWKDMTHNVQPTVFMFNTYLNLLSVKMDFTNVLKVIQDMKKQGIQPNHITYQILSRSPKSTDTLFDSI